MDIQAIYEGKHRSFYLGTGFIWERVLRVPSDQALKPIFPGDRLVPVVYHLNTRTLYGKEADGSIRFVEGLPPGYSYLASREQASILGLSSCDKSVIFIHTNKVMFNRRVEPVLDVNYHLWAVPKDSVYPSGQEPPPNVRGAMLPCETLDDPEVALFSINNLDYGEDGKLLVIATQFPFSAYYHVDNIDPIEAQLAFPNYCPLRYEQGIICRDNAGLFWWGPESSWFIQPPANIQAEKVIVHLSKKDLSEKGGFVVPYRYVNHASGRKVHLTFEGRQWNGSQELFVLVDGLDELELTQPTMPTPTRAYYPPLRNQRIVLLSKGQRPEDWGWLTLEQARKMYKGIKKDEVVHFGYVHGGRIRLLEGSYVQFRSHWEKKLVRPKAESQRIAEIKRKHPELRSIRSVSLAVVEEVARRLELGYRLEPTVQLAFRSIPVEPSLYQRLLRFLPQSEDYYFCYQVHPRGTIELFKPIPLHQLSKDLPAEQLLNKKYQQWTDLSVTKYLDALALIGPSALPKVLEVLSYALELSASEELCLLALLNANTQQQ